MAFRGALAITFAGLTLQVAGFPQNDLIFPEDESETQQPTSASSGGLEDRFHQGYRPYTPWDDEFYRPPEFAGPPHHLPSRDEFKPLSTRPDNSFRPTSNSRPNFEPQNSRPVGNFKPPSFRPENTRPLGSRPGQDPRPQSFRPVQDTTFLGPNENPPFTRPGEGFSVQGFRPNEGFRPQGSRPNVDFRPQFLRPNDNLPQSSPSSEAIKPSLRPSESLNPNDLRPIGNSGSSNIEMSEDTDNSNNSPQGSMTEDFINPQFGVVSSTEATDTTTGSSQETTTKIPRRDPTYRIVFTAPCPCSFTRQYTPVCGTDGQTYGNLGVLECAQQCGKDVRIFLMGSCGRNNGHPGAISLNPSFLIRGKATRCSLS